MAEIGTFGDITFEVNGDTVKTFNELAEAYEGRWAVHEVINSIPLSEFLGPNLDTFSMNIILTKMLGADPIEDFEQIRDYVKTGEHFPLIIDGTPLSQNDFYLINASKVSTVFAAGKGTPLWSEITIEGREYK